MNKVSTYNTSRGILMLASETNKMISILMVTKFLIHVHCILLLWMLSIHTIIINFYVYRPPCVISLMTVCGVSWTPPVLVPHALFPLTAPSTALTKHLNSSRWIRIYQVGA